MNLKKYTLQSLTGPVHGQNRVLFSLAGIPVMKTGFSPLEILHRENPVLITGMGLQCTMVPQVELFLFVFENLRIEDTKKYV